MSSSPPSSAWLTNHLAVASKIATSIEAYAVRQRMDAADILEVADGSLWAMFAQMAGCESDYTPSYETKLIVKGLIAHGRAKVCTSCGLTQASREATKGGRPGNEVCDRCHRQDFADQGEARE